MAINAVKVLKVINQNCSNRHIIDGTSQMLHKSKGPNE